MTYIKMRTDCHSLYHHIVLFTAASLFSISAGVGILSENCKQNLRDLPPTKQASFCQGNSSFGDLRIPDAPCLKETEVISITDFHLYSNDDRATRNCSELTKFKYSYIYNASCLTNLSQRYSGKVRQLLTPVMQAVSGKGKGAIDTTSFASRINKKLDETGFQDLPGGTWMYLEFKCYDKTTSKVMPYMDICEQLHVHDITNVQIGFSDKMYYKSGNKSICSCNITSQDTTDNSISIQAIDVRLKNGLSLKLQDQKSHGIRSLNQYDLYWWLDGVLLSSTGSVIIELSELSPNRLPDNIWLEVKGKNLTVSCGSEQISTISESQTGSSELSVISIVGIVIGVVVSIIIIFVLIGCVRRMAKGSKHDDSDLHMEALSSEAGSPTTNPKQARDFPKRQESSHSGSIVPAEDDSKLSLLKPDEDRYYTELETEHEYEETPGSNNNIKAEIHHPVKNQIPEDPSSKPDEGDHNIYNHLREDKRPDVVPTVNIYDTAGSSDYAQLQRNAASPNVIDNVYSSLS